MSKSAKSRWENFYGIFRTKSTINALDICDGLITRSRVVENKREEAVLDFYVVNEKILPHVKKMIVDENKEFGLIKSFTNEEE